MSATELGRLDPQAPTPLRRSSLLRRMAAEPVMSLLVQRALVMEVAHPKVAAGVDHHSGFREHPWLRAWSTADVALRLVFGSTEVARSAAAHIYGVHDHINGALREPAGDWPAGEPYTAHDASLLAWVWATLVDSAEVAYTRWVGRFSSEEADRYYGEQLAMARFLGIAMHLLPPDRHAFAAYMESMMHGEVLGSTHESKDLARQILWYRHRSVPRALVRVERVLAFATLDPVLLETLELHPSAADERLGRRIDGALRAGYRWVPSMRRWPAHLYSRTRVGLLHGGLRFWE